MKEIFKEINGTNGKYKIGNNGTVINVEKNNILEGTISYGYLTYGLYYNNKINSHKAHILVATYFVENPNGYPIINHIDENKLNNNYKNLEWCTYEQNANHATRNNRISKTKSYPICEYNHSGEYIRTWNNVKDVVKVYGCSLRGLQNAASSECSCFGRRWRYYDELDFSPNLPPYPIGSRQEKINMTYTEKYNYDKNIPDEFIFKIKPVTEKLSNKDKLKLIIEKLSIINNSDHLTKKEKAELEKVNCLLLGLEI